MITLKKIEAKLAEKKQELSKVRAMLRSQNLKEKWYALCRLEKIKAEIIEIKKRFTHKSKLRIN